MLNLKHITTMTLSLLLAHSVFAATQDVKVTLIGFPTNSSVGPQLVQFGYQLCPTGSTTCSPVKSTWFDTLGTATIPADEIKDNVVFITSLKADVALWGPFDSNPATNTCNTIGGNNGLTFFYNATRGSFVTVCSKTMTGVTN